MNNLNFANYILDCGCRVEIKKLVMPTPETLKLEDLAIEYCNAHREKEKGRAPGGKTDTSVKAAERLRSSLSKIEARVLAYLQNPKMAPMTANRIAELSGIPLHTVRPRLTWLQAVGKVRDSGQRFHISEKKTAIAWEAVR